MESWGGGGYDLAHGLVFRCPAEFVLSLHLYRQHNLVVAGSFTARFPRRRPGFETGSGHVGFLGYDVALEKVFSE
jgi:hypothetical protein